MAPVLRKRELRKCLHHVKQKRVKGVDYFSRLPDELIVSHILSRFTLEEGARFSILSHRWYKLWACTIGSNLIFAPEHLQTIQPSKLMLDYCVTNKLPINMKADMVTIDYRVNKLSACFERWISKVIQAYDMPKLDELTVRFPFNYKSSDSIDKWLECALSKGVSRLELDLLRWGSIPDYDRRYEFPTLEKLRANCGGLCLYNLRDVCLKYVIVSPDVIEFMLACFPIQRLCLHTTQIGELTISGPSVRIKTLEVVMCGVYLNISATSLESFTYAGRENRVLIQHAPHLSILSVDWVFCTTFLQNGFSNGGGYISRLKKLELVMSEEVVRESVNYPLEFPGTLDIEELKIEIYGVEEACFLWPILLIGAAPFLHTFSVRFLMMTGLNQQYDGRLLDLRNAVKRVRHHQCLKTVELCNYFGQPSESEFVQHLLGVSETLEQVLVSPRQVNDPSLAWIVKKQAEEIARWLPLTLNAKLTVL